LSTSPFLTPGRHGRRSGGPRRRRWWIAALGIGVLAAAAAVAVTMATANHGRHAPRHAAALRRAPVLATSPPRSPAGLPLGKPAFRLSGLGTPRHEAVPVVFHTPPRAGLEFDLSSGRVLWQRNAARRLPIASLTKMMTALITVESAAPSEPVLVSRAAVDANGSKVGVLPVNRHVRLESMLYGLMLPSGNDAAVALAQHVSGTVARFVARMNAKAATLGMGCTRFSSPHGFYDQGNFSCAADLAVLAHYDLAQRRIARIAHTYHAVLPFPIKGGKLYLANNNPLLIYGYPGTTGLKTGYTVAAGRCLVATAQRHGVRLGVVLLDSTDPATQAKKLFDGAFQRVYHQRPVPEPAIPPQA
jgi:D-alanyl-D-alanine carboxypeptidase (penicillin-binding protein 5/6)